MPNGMGREYAQQVFLTVKGRNRAALISLLVQWLDSSNDLTCTVAWIRSLPSHKRERALTAMRYFVRYEYTHGRIGWDEASEVLGIRRWQITKGGRVGHSVREVATRLSTRNPQFPQSLRDAAMLILFNKMGAEWVARCTVYTRFDHIELAKWEEDILGDYVEWRLGLGENGRAGSGLFPAFVGRVSNGKLGNGKAKRYMVGIRGRITAQGVRYALEKWERRERRKEI